MRNHTKRGIILSAACAAVLLGLMLATAGATTRTVTDPSGDVVVYETHGFGSAATTCTPAATGYAHVDLTSVSVSHESGVGYTITVAVAGAFNLTSLTEIRIAFLVNGSYPAGGPSAFTSPIGPASYTFYLQIQASSGTWFNRTQMADLTELGYGVIDVSGNFVFTIGPSSESYINGTPGFSADFSTWGICGWASDRIADYTYALDILNWANLKTILEATCGGGGIPGYEVPLVLLGIAASCTILVARKLKK